MTVTNFLLAASALTSNSASCAPRVSAGDSLGVAGLSAALRAAGAAPGAAEAGNAPLNVAPAATPTASTEVNVRRPHVDCCLTYGSSGRKAPSGGSLDA